MRRDRCGQSGMRGASDTEDEAQTAGTSEVSRRSAVAGLGAATVRGTLATIGTLTGTLAGCLGGPSSGTESFSEGGSSPETGTTDASGTQRVPWGVAQVGARNAHADGVRGDGIDVAVIDTGVAPNHPDLTDIGTGTSVVSNRRAVTASATDGTRTSERDGTRTSEEVAWADTSGHGTHVAGVIGARANDRGVVGVAPRVKLHPIRVFRSPERGDVANVAAGLRWAADRGYDVANVSISTRIPSDELAAAVRQATTAGVVVCAATAPENVNTPGYPAAYDDVIAVGATTRDGTPAEFSRTDGVDVFAPGVEVTATVPDGYARRSGTSVACPHVSGGAALLRELGYDRAETVARLRNIDGDLPRLRIGTLIE